MGLMIKAGATFSWLAVSPVHSSGSYLLSRVPRSAPICPIVLCNTLPRVSDLCYCCLLPIVSFQLATFRAKERSGCSLHMIAIRTETTGLSADANPVRSPVDGSDPADHDSPRYRAILCCHRFLAASSRPQHAWQIPSWGRIRFTCCKGTLAVLRPSTVSPRNVAQNCMMHVRHRKGH